jgi:23S rRNA (cytidine2498-2'-O)-methyltransferase
MVRAVPEFLFATCLFGVELALKQDVAIHHPALRPAFQRPGLVTFKVDGEVALDGPAPSPFARCWGRSLGSAADPAAALALVRAAGAARIHVVARAPREDAPPDLAPWRAALGSIDGSIDAPAELGELVATVLVADGEPAMVGLHRHSAARSPYPGDDYPVVLPPEAPSRAYAKIEEAIAWAGLPVAVGHVALEIGAAPGGACLALARRGVTVWGVDTGAIAPAVLAYRHPSGAQVHHLATKVGALRWEALPPVVDWLLVDVNLAPQVALHAIARLMPKLRPTLRGAVFTLKLNDWSFVAELDALTARIAQLGLPDVRLRHLPSNRREICAVALPAAANGRGQSPA